MATTPYVKQIPSPLTTYDIEKAHPSSMYSTIQGIVDRTKAYADTYNKELKEALEDLGNIPDYVDGNFDFPITPINVGDMEDVAEPSYPQINTIDPMQEVDEPAIDDVGNIVEKDYPDDIVTNFDDTPVSYNDVKKPNIDTDITVERATKPTELVLDIPIKKYMVGTYYQADYEKYDFTDWDSLLIPIDTSSIDNFDFPDKDVILGTYDSVIEPVMIPKLLQEFKDGSHGLSEEVFNAIVDMEARKRAAVEADAREKLVESMGQTGFDVPSGVLLAKLAEHDRDVINRTMDSIDSTKIKSFDLAQTNTHHLRDLLLRAEEVFSRRFISLEELKVSVARFIHETALAKFNALVAQVNAKYDYIRMQLELKTKKLDAIIAYNEGERQKVLLDIEKAKVELDAIKTDNNSEIEKAKALSAIHSVNATLFQVIQSANVEEAKFKLDKSKQLLDMYGVEVDAEKVKATIKLEIRKLNNEQEKLKAEIYRIQTDATTAVNKGRLDVLKSRLDINNSRLAVYTALVNARGDAKKIELEIENMKAKLTQTLAGVYDTKIRAALSKYQGKIDVAKLLLQRDNQYMTGIIAKENARLQGFQVTHGFRQEALKVHGQFATQAMASALGVTNVNLGYNYSGQESLTASRRLSTSLNNSLQESHSYKDV